MNEKLHYVLFVLVSLFAISANAAPMAFSVNSDSGNQDTEDSLYRIDLATGVETRIGELRTGIPNDTRVDTEGLAIAPDGTLWGVDDESRTLFKINTASGVIKVQDEILLTGFQAGGNDFGMTFSCDNSLYITSVRTRTLYRLSITDGSSEVIGAVDALGVNISAIAAYGTPTKLYGLGNGQFQNGTTDSPNLYSIDTATGVAALIGPLGVEASEYIQGGLAFDATGTLWAITDRSVINNSFADLPSQILQLDVNTGTATLISTTNEVGFESLAIAPPTACSPDGDDYPRIPTLSPAGQLLTIFILLLVGMTVLRRSY